MKSEIKGIEKRYRTQLKEKKSKFIATLAPVFSEGEALAFIEEMKKEFYDANHNVYAYIIEEGLVMKASDDGEPTNSSGPPVLKVLQSWDLTNAIIVVTRYFGGVKLGIGGLIRAYSASARLVLQKAALKKYILISSYAFKVNYQHIGQATAIFAQKGIEIENIEYSNQGAKILVSLNPKQNTTQLTFEIKEAVQGNLSVDLLQQKYEKKENT